jgi:hypothetical protein
MRIFRNLLIPALSIVLFSCQQEIDDILTNPPGNGNNNNNPTGGAYQPLTSASWWKYKDSSTGTQSTTTITAVSKTFNGIAYKAITSGNGDTAYQGVKGPNYYMRIAGVSPNTGAPYDLTLNYLNDTASVGYTWQHNAGQGNGFAAITYTTILEKGLTMTVEGKTYTNVIHTFIDFQYDIAGSNMPYAEYEFYIAKDIGIIKTRGDIGPGLLKTCSNLVDHHIQ